MGSLNHNKAKKKYVLNINKTRHVLHTFKTLSGIPYFNNHRSIDIDAQQLFKLFLHTAIKI